MALSLVSLNIEGRKHFDTITPFLKQEQPDVFCVQELCKQDVSYFEAVLDAPGTFMPLAISNVWQDEIGVGIFTPHQVTFESHWYGGNKGPLRRNDTTSMETRYESCTFSLLVARVTKENEAFTIGTTHFPVTEGGQVTDFQREALENLLAVLAEYDDIVFCGDLNAPRGREIFDAIKVRYTDHIPPEYESSLDPNIHRAGPIPFVVDGLFSTGGYVVTDVAYHCGVSDHCAIQATIECK
ncbi:MAG: endonuclease/exonuclease/phosphatase family protein [Candidatus Paceibacterota bacterium]